VQDTNGEAFLRTLGERVRELRARRGMTRRSLASESGVSERYLAQLEAGQGNASILVIRHLAHAFGIAPEVLVAASDRAPETAGVIATIRSLSAGWSRPATRRRVRGGSHLSVCAAAARPRSERCSRTSAASRSSNWIARSSATRA